MSKRYEQLKTYMDRVMAIKTAMTLFEWDNETLAPQEAGELTSQVIGVLSGEYFQALTCSELRQRLKECREDEALSEPEAANVRELWEELGIRVLPGELERKTRFVREDAIWDVYLLRRPILLEELRLQKEEVSQAAWMTPEEILRLAREGKAVSYPEFFDLLEKARQDWID